jgi:hypothetical protein
MKKKLKAMPMYSKVPSVTKTTIRKKIMFRRKLKFLLRKTRKDSKDISHQGGLT